MTDQKNDTTATDDSVPSTVNASEVTMLEHIGGRERLREWVDAFHAALLEDPLVGTMFAKGKPTHAFYLTDFYEEVMGGRMRYTERHNGVEGLYDAHRNLCITDEQRARFVELAVEAADTAALPSDQRFRSALRQRIEDGSMFSYSLSQPGAEGYNPWPPVGVFDW